MALLFYFVRSLPGHVATHHPFGGHNVSHTSLPTEIRPYLVFCQSADDYRTHHPRQSADAVRNAHEDAGIAWSDIQVVHVETYTSKCTERVPLFIILMFSSNYMNPIADVMMGDNALPIVTQYLVTQEANRPQYYILKGTLFSLFTVFNKQMVCFCMCFSLIFLFLCKSLKNIFLY